MCTIVVLIIVITMLSALLPEKLLIEKKSERQKSERSKSVGHLTRRTHCPNTTTVGAVPILKFH